MEFNPTYNEAVSFVEIVKQRFQHQENVYRKICSIFAMFRGRLVDPESLISKVEIMFNDHADLISMFHNFFPKNLPMAVAGDRNTAPVFVPTTLEKSSDEGRIDEVKDDGREKTKLCIEFVNRVAETLQDDYKYKSFLDAVNDLGKFKNIAQVRDEVYVIFKDHPELDIEFSSFLTDYYEANSRVEKDANLSFFSMSTSAKGVAKKKNYKQIMFKCEVETYEADMEYHSLQSTMEAVDQMVMKLKRNPNEMVCIEDYFSVLNLKYLKKFYGDRRVLRMRRNPIDSNAVTSIELDLNNEYVEVKKRLERARIKCARTMKEIHEEAYNQESAKRTSPESTLTYEENKGIMESENEENPRFDPKQVQPIKRIKLKFPK
ncbi:paired amphipathic helix Sin3-like 2 [Olea europaea subsp. europaea]|uniref:Paired amphipathic helix Sin3-like 2 n=1 Tax=Olea europaea subsp. europaea TaxID=158383 RepID=A0A8S0V980_OLEEU|nr:paired amphipathic helix Sin3-like 2 [Olea europaea subsp. europaea]